ncbi:MAG: 50S ribosomal protein L22 [Bdellovibrionales bacterium RIFOXYD12_FULL_39_22]|nr:MAG: 50S ribosomal protein L22 [Bdellovibrionales bacterium RIFOXYB1_FULL_39_21]OFZ43378.1 MAG: 50S ribosomal protein L22 [Bdellovibrionales bacterium RIFOXYC12_FULL_39_17]OFZ47397.1 MAG: 50S ribosomal protein L22 [Bdellovibrionales bacterium RIFOXYC1_FULL_39_130]OFZ73859.1 MAG: 50S ribosomal protein L22 [Bdellovibrionales bacterium RIFOXYC2_FULL_39_8]OFZ76277.1 MAG: 50S ribosomal protein L22 [Bdellovibrionales bacterium RIFOXYD1_FULL_39_84]OFZ94315.1 MAG: 50S ribosomal protein L22 [Bdellov
MSVIVKNRMVQIAPRKIRLVCDLIRKKKASEAMKILRFCEKREIAIVLTKLINSGLAIASESGKYDLDNLVISRIFADEGPTMKRIQARAQGRAYRIRKRTGHITVELNEA